MAMRHKSSVTPGNTPNLLPGQIGINVPDDLLYFRANGRVCSINMGKWRTGAAPARGAQDGAPLSIGPDGNPTWDTELAPSSRVNGKVEVDTPPAIDAYSVPGVRFQGPADDLVMGVNDVIVERFYVASDQINATRIAYEIISRSPGNMRLAILDANFETMAANSTTAVAPGIRNFSMVTALPRGTYYLMVWSASATVLKSLRVLAPEQGWDLSAQEDIQFVQRLRATKNFAAGIDFDDVTLVPVTSDQPGEHKSLLLRWVYPT